MISKIKLILEILEILENFKIFSKGGRSFTLRGDKNVYSVLFCRLDRRPAR